MSHIKDALYFGGKLEILGGIALIGIGCKILLSAIS